MNFSTLARSTNAFPNNDYKSTTWQFLLKRRWKFNEASRQGPRRVPSALVPSWNIHVKFEAECHEVAIKIALAILRFLPFRSSVNLTTAEKLFISPSRKKFTCQGGGEIQLTRAKLLSSYASGFKQFLCFSINILNPVIKLKYLSRFRFVSLSPLVEMDLSL